MYIFKIIKKHLQKIYLQKLYYEILGIEKNHVYIFAQKNIYKNLTASD